VCVCVCVCVCVHVLHVEPARFYTAAQSNAVRGHGHGMVGCSPEALQGRAHVLLVAPVQQDKSRACERARERMYYVYARASKRDTVNVHARVIHSIAQFIIIHVSHAKTIQEAKFFAAVMQSDCKSAMDVDAFNV
jgi:hypothetical protein